jgi:RHS repeat-associated protein
VDCATGLFLHQETDVALPDVRAIALTRTYRPGDSAAHAFGIGTSHDYEMHLWSAVAYSYQNISLVLPDGGRVDYVRTSPGTGFADAVLEHASTATKFYKSKLTWNASLPGWNLSLKNGMVYQFSGFSGGRLLAIKDRYGNTVSLTRNGVQITRISSPNGRTIDLSYDAASRITEATDVLGRTVRYTYDPQGRLATVTDVAGGVTEYTYDASHRMLTVKDPRGNLFVQNEYDANGRVIKQTYADGGTNTLAYTLDANGQVTQTDVTDERGFVRRTRFDANHALVGETHALGQPEQQTLSYERQAGTNLLLKVTDALGRQTTYTYDALGNTTKVTRLAGTAQAVSTSFTYTPSFNQVATVKDPLNRTTTFAYDALGNLTSVTDPLLNKTTFTYNAAGQPLTATNALGHKVSFTYDFGDLVQITNPLNRIIKRFVDAAGRVLSVTDPQGRITRTDYDALDRVTRVIDPQGGVIAYTYDANGNRLSLSDPKGNVTTYAYDAMNRVVTRTDGLLKPETYAYDLAGNLTKTTDRKGQVTSYRYDALGRRSFTGFGTTAGPAPIYESTLTSTYDAGNRITQLADSASGTITRSYDGLNRLLSEVTLQGTVNYSYDAVGRRTGMTASGQSAVSYTYDNADRLTKITQDLANVGFAYDKANRRTSLTLPNGIVVSYAYDNAAQLTGMTYKQGTTVLGDLTYTYDTAGRRIAQGGSLAGTDVPQAVNTTSYDANNRLKQWETSNLVYDDNGNLTFDGVNAYSWNARNQLTAISGNVTASFAYDARGRRVRKTIAGTTTGYRYDGLNLVQELDGSNNPTARFLTGLGIDEVFTRTDSNGPRHFLTDALGSTRALTDGTGAITTRYSYEPFGKTTVNGTDTNAVQYTGRENDGTGLYYYRARYYHPGLHRFVSEDPIGFAGGINTYAYVGGNPVSFVDPLGLTGLSRGWSPLHSHHDHYSNPPGEGSDVVPPMQATFPPGFWAGDKGAEEWGRRNGCGKDEGRRRFHDIKQSDNRSQATDKYGVNPSTGDVIDPEGEVIGNLDE